MNLDIDERNVTRCECSTAGERGAHPSHVEPAVVSAPGFRGRGSRIRDLQSRDLVSEASRIA